MLRLSHAEVLTGAGTQAMVLSLLGNTATLPEVLQAVSISTTADGQPAVVTVTKLLSSQDSDLKVKAATLVGNLCHDSSLRAQVCYICPPASGWWVAGAGSCVFRPFRNPVLCSCCIYLEVHGGSMPYASSWHGG